MGRRDKGFHTPFAVLAKVKPVRAAEEKAPAAASARSRPVDGGPHRAPPDGGAASARSRPVIDDGDLFLREVAGARPLEGRGPRVGAPPPARRPKVPVSDDAEVLASLAD